MTPKKKPAGEGNPQTGYVTSSAINDTTTKPFFDALIDRFDVVSSFPVICIRFVIHRLTGGRP